MNLEAITRYKELGLTTLNQVAILYYLKYHGPVSLTPLCETLKMSTASGTSIVSKLERMGLVRRTRDAQDTRKVWITLAEGAKV